MRKLIISIVLLLFLLSSNTLLYAQRQGGRGGKPPQGMRQGKGKEHRPDMNKRGAMQDLKRLERLRMMKLLDLLDLDEKTETKFIPQIRNHQKEMFSLMRKHRGEIDKLAKGLRNKKLSDKEIIQRIKVIDKLDLDRQEKIRAFNIQVRVLLTAEQLGKLYVFQARFGGEVLEKMGHFRKAQEEYRKRESGQ